MAGKAEGGYSSFSPAGKSVPTLLLMLRTAAIFPADLFYFIFLQYGLQEWENFTTLNEQFTRCLPCPIVLLYCLF